MIETSSRETETRTSRDRDRDGERLIWDRDRDHWSRDHIVSRP